MTNLKDMYQRGLGCVGDAPSWRTDWRWITLYGLCIYAIVLAFRISFASRWDHPELWVNGERILATHDAYFWLAKAKGLGTIDWYPLALATRYFHEITGISLGSIGFWAPAVIGSLVGVVCYLWGWLLGGRHAGLFAGLVGSLTPGFFYRSRLGYFDTDVFTLIGPMFVAWMLAYYVSFWTKKGWFIASSVDSIGKQQSLSASYGLAFGFGLATRFLCMWHYDILTVCILYFFLSVAILIINGRPDSRSYGIYGLIIYLFAAFPGASHSTFGYSPSLDIFPYSYELFYISVSMCLFAVLIVMEHRKQLIFESKWIYLVGLCTAVWMSGIGQSPIGIVISKLSVYFQDGAAVVPAGAAMQGPIFPTTVQSIIEAKLIPLNAILERGAISASIGWIALIASLFVVLLRPAAAFLIPLIVLQLLSMKMGVRFSMFGGAALMVFLGGGLFGLTNLIAKRFSSKVVVLVSVQAVLALSVLGYLYKDYSKIPITPVVTKPHAEALIELENVAPKGSMIWTWWDWGYASQYYAGLGTTIDGGLHSGSDVYPTALVLSTDSISQANGMVQLAAQYKPNAGRGYSIVSGWRVTPAHEIVTEVGRMREGKTVLPRTKPQYLVVTWKDFTIAKWITYFGNWNLKTGSTREATASYYKPGELGFNIERGAVMNRAGGGGLVSDITLLSQKGATTKEYYLNRLSPRLLPKTRHLFINEVSRESVLMDRTGKRSMLVRLLTGDPDDPEISKYFKLVVDKMPFARIYEVVQ